MRNDVCIAVYTHQNRSSLWNIFFSRLKKHAPQFPVFAMNNTDEIAAYVEKERCHVYSDKEDFSESWKPMCDKMIASGFKYMVFSLEDEILYADVNIKMFEESVQLVESRINKFSKLIKSGGSEFCFQVGLHNIKDYMDLLTVYPIKRIWDEQELSIKSMGKYESPIIPEEWVGFKRGLYHYDSKVWPYIATALDKGKWNSHEYPSEIQEIFNEFNGGQKIMV